MDSLDEASDWREADDFVGCPYLRTALEAATSVLVLDVDDDPVGIGQERDADA